ncbi:MAG TPA: thiamine phosphate synthase [Polyangiaceae bacterium]|nr:thiamine phosphate synthase [Polyangiaceae bacterium]
MTVLALPRLLAFTDTENYPRPAERLAPLLHAAPPRSIAVVVRDRQQEPAARFALAQELAACCRSANQRLWLATADQGGADQGAAEQGGAEGGSAEGGSAEQGGDLALAESVGAEGLHLAGRGPSALPLRAAAPLRPISRAWHVGDAWSDEELGALSAVVISPVCEARKGRQPLGLDGFEAVSTQLRARAPRLGTYALGGVGALHLAELLARGATGLAAIGAAHADDCSGLVEALRLSRSFPS